MFLFGPGLSRPIYYTPKQLNNIIKLSKNDDKKALNRLMFYYYDENEEKNLFLVACKMNQNREKHKISLRLERGKNYNYDNCPLEPLSQLKNTFFLKYIKNVFHSGFFIFEDERIKRDKKWLEP